MVIDKQGGGAHGIGLGEGQGFEESAGLLLQGKDRQEGDGDHQQRVEEGRPHLLGRIGDDLPVRLLASVSFQMFMGVFDHDDGGVDHCPDGDGNAAQAHDVGVDPLEAHDHEGHQNRHRQGEDGHQGAGQMKKEDGRDQGDDDTLFDQLFPQVIDGMVNQPGAIVNRLDLYPGWQPGLEIRRASS